MKGRSQASGFGRETDIPEQNKSGNNTAQSPKSTKPTKSTKTARSPQDDGDPTAENAEENHRRERGCGSAVRSSARKACAHAFSLPSRERGWLLILAFLLLLSFSFLFCSFLFFSFSFSFLKLGLARVYSSLIEFRPGIGPAGNCAPPSLHPSSWYKTQPASVPHWHPHTRIRYHTGTRTMSAIQRIANR